ncbi:MtrAB system accessory lipoprotein LpqB [Corynebacterium choanae]|uniref:Lipoprotein LpqB n=1 Tax=Corynebacterium choanae TaxID=1862358 RepID=A0A3G6J4P0_9CORY|nr:MtrAB system accessory lipoprotein LpqB [Corynebacterium choanae]AZA12916.1 Lipoprotein LpqB precursor [Corynebacterium choanae]
MSMSQQRSNGGTGDVAATVHTPQPAWLPQPRPRRETRPLAIGAIVATLALGISGCGSLPGDSNPQVLRTFEASTPTEVELAPKPGQEPDLLLRDFFTASAKPAQKHQAARAYLTDTAAAAWDDTTGTLIVNRIDLISEPGASADSITYSVRGDVVGQLGTGGVFTPQKLDYEAQIELVKANGEWRISTLPAGVVMERNELRNRYTPRDLFFFNPTGKWLVPDRRWVYDGQSNLDTALLSLLMEGPQRRLAPGVLDDVPAEAVFAGYEQGVYRFTGFEDLDADARHRFSAQVVWVLARANIPGPYRIELDGAPVVPGQLGLTVDDVAEFNPTAKQATIAPLYAVVEGALNIIEGEQLSPVPGPLGGSKQIQSADVSATGGVVAAVLGDPGDALAPVRLELGPLGDATQTIQTARSLTRPSFERDATALWTVVDSRTITRIARSTATGEVSQIEVDTTALFDPAGQTPAATSEQPPITALQLAPSGVRAAFIRDGRLYVATVARPQVGQRALIDAVEVSGPNIAGSAKSVDWTSDGALLVGTANALSPVWIVAIDGSAQTPLPSGNITAPVVDVAASVSTYYLTDANAMLQLPTQSSSASFWREVPAVLGRRATPIIAE